MVNFRISGKRSLRNITKEKNVIKGLTIKMSLNSLTATEETIRQWSQCLQASEENVLKK